MKKLHIKNLILSFLAVVLCCGTFVLSSLSANAKVVSAITPPSNSPVEKITSNAIKQQTNQFAINSLTNLNPTNSNEGLILIELYKDGNYAYYSLNGKDYSTNSDGTTFIHKTGNSNWGDWGTGNSDKPTTNSPKNGQFASYISLSRNIAFALKNGHVKIDASASYSSEKCYSSDSVDSIRAELMLYSSADNNLRVSDIKDWQELSDFKLEEFTFQTEQIADIYDSLEFSIKNKLKGTGWYNVMKIQNPIIKFTTSDVTAPTLDIDFDKATDEWTNSRIVTIDVSDNDSGIQKVEYKLGNGEWTVLEGANFIENLEYVTEKSLSFEMTTNEKLKIRVTDNVGYMVEKEYEENHIDRVSPSLTVNTYRVETDLSFDFNVNLFSNHSDFVSPESYYYTYTLNGVTSEKISLSNGLNHFETDEVGEYEFSFYAEDEAGNSMTPIVMAQIFKKQIIIDSVVEKYIYSDEVIDLEYSKPKINGEIASAEELEKAGFTLNITQGEKTATIKDVGNYNYAFGCSNEYYILEKSGTAIVDPYKLALSVTENSFEYDRHQKGLLFTIDKDVPVSVVYTDLEGNIITPVSIGEYLVTIKYVADQNYVLDETVKLNIIPHKLKVVANNVSLDYGTLSMNFDEDLKNYFSMSVTGALEGDNLIFDLVCDYLKDAGTYTITFKQKSGLSSEEEQILKNYDIEYVDGVLEINKISAYILPGENQSKVYSELDPNEFYYSVSGLVYNDELNLKLTRESGEDVGFYQYTLESFENKNYNLVVIPSTFQITKRIAYVIVDNNQSKVYGDSDPAFTFSTLSSNVLEKDIEFIQSCIVREAGENVGVYKLSFDKTKAKNYAVVFIGSNFTINKKDLTIIADEIHAEYGDEQSLTYKTVGLVSGDTLYGTLTREQGTTLGEYTISQGTLSNENYNISFVGAKYIIGKKHIVIEVNSSSKHYGEADNLTYTISGTDASLSITLKREIGEDAGVYDINGYVFDDLNYEVEFISGKYEILPAELSVKINSSNKTFGNVDPEFTYEVVGLVNKENLTLPVVREVGENVGIYRLYLGEMDLQNYVITSVEEADFEITKADVELILNDKTVTYNGSAFHIDAIDTPFDITYTYTTKNGRVVEPSNIVNAGEYKVYAYFAGDENHNEATSNVATILIKQKLVPITLKKCAFNYTGNAQAPEFDINLDEDVSVIVTYVSGVIDPTEVGEYDFIITSNDINYTCSLTDMPFGGTLVIFEGFMSSTDGAQAVSDSVGLSSFGIQLFEDRDSNLKSRFNALRDGRRCLSVYNFKTTDEYQGNGDVVTVSIKASDNKDVKIYTIDSTGRMCAVSYTVKGGYYVLSVNDLSSSILVTASDNTMMFAKVITVTLILFLCYFITKTVRRNKRNHFFKRNTTIKYVDYEELKSNSEIVEAVSFEAEVVSGDKFIDN